MNPLHLEILNRLHLEEMLKRAQQDSLTRNLLPSLSNRITHLFLALARRQQTLQPKAKEVN